MIITKVANLKYEGLSLIYEIPVLFQDDNYSFEILIRYTENPSSCGYRGWRELEAIRTSQFWINQEKGFCDYYILWHLKDTFKIDFPNNKLSVEETDKLFSEVLVELKKIMHERKIEIPGYNMEV